MIKALSRFFEDTLCILLVLNPAGQVIACGTSRSGRYIAATSNFGVPKTRLSHIAPSTRKFDVYQF